MDQSLLSYPHVQMLIMMQHVIHLMNGRNVQMMAAILTMIVMYAMVVILIRIVLVNVSEQL